METKTDRDCGVKQFEDLNLNCMQPKPEQTGVWVLNAMIVAMAVLVAALAGVAFIATNSGWAIVACVITENSFVVMHSVFMARIARL